MAPTQPGRGSDQFPLRLPDGMRDRLKESAAGNGRSMNAEIVARLEESFDADAKIVAVNSASRLVEEMRKEAIEQIEYYKNIREKEEETWERTKELEKQRSEEREKYRQMQVELKRERDALREEVEKKVRGELEKRNESRIRRMEERESRLQELAERLDQREKELFAAIHALSGVGKAE